MDLIKIQILIKEIRRFCISNKLPGDVDAAGPWTTSEVARLEDLYNYLAIPELQYDFVENKSSMIICCIFK